MVAAIAGMLVAMVGGTVTPAPGALLDGHALMESCADGTAYYAYGRCAGYVIGVHDEHARAGGDGVCVALDEGVIPDALVQPVVAYLEGNPDRLSEPAAALVVEALARAYPCR